MPLLPPLTPPPAPAPPASAAATLAQPEHAPAASASGSSDPVERLRASLAARDPGLPQRLAATGEPLDSSALQRWLHARGGDVEAAAAGLEAHAAWRESYIGAGGVSEASIGRELAARKVSLQGCDAEGCPVVVVQASRHDLGARDLAETRRLICYTLDSACATADPSRNPAGRICCLFDLSGACVRVAAATLGQALPCTHIGHPAPSRPPAPRYLTQACAPAT